MVDRCKLRCGLIPAAQAIWLLQREQQPAISHVPDPFPAGLPVGPVLRHVHQPGAGCWPPGPLGQPCWRSRAAAEPFRTGRTWLSATSPNATIAADAAMTGIGNLDVCHPAQRVTCAAVRSAGEPSYAEPPSSPRCALACLHAPAGPEVRLVAGSGSMIGRGTGLPPPVPRPGGRPGQAHDDDRFHPRCLLRCRPGSRTAEAAAPPG